MSEDVVATTREKTVPELLGQLASETADLVRQEATLATKEIGDKASVVLRQVVLVVVALLLATVSLMTLIAALVMGLAAYVPAWASAAAVGVIVAGVAWGLYAKTLATLSDLTPVPERTVQTLKDNKAWLRQQTR